MDHGNDCPTVGLPGVVIVGGGFSGTMVAVHLAVLGIPATVIDCGERPARGLAYSTTLPDHLLNVRASNMSAFPDRPDDFVNHIAHGGSTPDIFARRSDYGDYLDAIFRKALATGLVNRVAGNATKASRRERGWSVELEDGSILAAPTLVLATGNGAPGSLAAFHSIRPEDLVDKLWSPAGAARLARAAQGNEPVLIAGTGLTMVDAVLWLDAAGHHGQVTAVSRRGLLPRSHAAPRACGLPPPALADLPLTVTSLCRWLRSRSEKEGDWRAAVDCLRPLSQQLWQLMAPDEQRRFLRHARIWWEVHRHRIATQVHDRVRRMMDEGRLQVMAGRLTSSRAVEDRYALSVTARGTGAMVEVEAGLVLNCTGPSHGLRDQGDRLIAQMHAGGLVRPDALGLGIEIDSSDRISGADHAYAIGPITRGRYWEIIAVPDLREKAANIAAMIARDHSTAAKPQARPIA